jgi:hypothetical protein
MQNYDLKAVNQSKIIDVNSSNLSRGTASNLLGAGDKREYGQPNTTQDVLLSNSRNVPINLLKTKKAN